MKRFFAIATMMVLTLSLGIAYADEMPAPFYETRGLGWEISNDFSTQGKEVAEQHIDMKGAKGTAAGGLGAQKAVTKPIDNTTYLGSEGSDLP